MNDAQAFVKPQKWHRGERVFFPSSAICAFPCGKIVGILFALHQAVTNSMACDFVFGTKNSPCLHRKMALTFLLQVTNFTTVDGRKGWRK
jgi:hypothetical protein